MGDMHSEGRTLEDKIADIWSGRARPDHLQIARDTSHRIAL